MEEVNQNSIIAEIINDRLDDFLESGLKIFTGTKTSIRSKLRNAHKKYLENLISKYSSVKGLFYPVEPVNIYDVYVPLGVSLISDSDQGQKKLGFNPSIIEITSIYKKSVISGTAGSGKSMLMRHLLLDCIYKKHKIPIFCELRELNQAKETVLDFLHASMQKSGYDFDVKFFINSLKKGQFALFFDGYDELNQELRSNIYSQIREITEKFCECIFIISSRPDVELDGMGDFTKLNINPLRLDQACSVVEKIPFDSAIKEKFLIDLKESLFEKHNSFLSIPLLLSIMLLTYGRSGDIPNKLSVFYNQAFEALFQRHDAMKGAYKRDRRSNLDIQDFSKIFAAFCIQTYAERKFQFSSVEALDFLEKSKKIVQIDFNIESFLKDVQQAVCLLIEDGGIITFSHRSFQEYFAAKFICDLKSDKQMMLIEKFKENVSRDNVISLVHEIKPEVIEEYFVIPKIDQIFQEISYKSGKPTKKVIKSYIQKTVKEVFISSKNIVITVNDFLYFQSIQFFIQKYGLELNFELDKYVQNQKIYDLAYKEIQKLITSSGSRNNSLLEIDEIIQNKYIYAYVANNPIFFESVLIFLKNLRTHLSKKLENSKGSIAKIFDL